MTRGNEGTERKTHRLEAFNDGVLAIAITLPVLDLKLPNVPHGGDLTAAYAALAPQYLAYALSFVVIGLYWAHSHFNGKLVQKTDHGFNLLNLIFLALVSITPFPTRPLVEHFSDSANNRAAATIYACLLAAPSLAWLMRWIYAVRFDLLDPRLSPTYLQKLTRSYSGASLALLGGVALTYLVDFRLGLVVVALITLSYVMPPLTPEWKRGQEPAHELEEADENPEIRHQAASAL
ncbi:MAG TPA: TMEM175 family protein [Abditibacterium sp.]|jgi:uncharacterized membrane protein